MKSADQDNLNWMLLRVAFRAKHRMMKLAEKYDITVVQLHSLGVLNPGEQIPMSALCDTLLCDPSNITGIADRLLSLGYIRREENPKDRRVKMIALTVAGEKLRAALLEELAEYESPSLRRLTADQKKELKEILGILLAR